MFCVVDLLGGDRIFHLWLLQSYEFFEPRVTGSHTAKQGCDDNPAQKAAQSNTPKVS